MLILIQLININLLDLLALSWIASYCKNENKFSWLSDKIISIVIVVIVVIVIVVIVITYTDSSNET